jgi:SAM-dependent methyltransferase
MPLSESSPDWDSLYREEHTPWDRGDPAPPLLEWLASRPGAVTGRVLVPGCGRGHDVRALASQPGVEEVVGLDFSPTAVSLASALSRFASERYVLGDLFALEDSHRGGYEWIWEHTCFCAIDPARRVDYVSSVHSALRPGGSLLGVFYLDPYDDEHQPGEGPPHGSTLEELAALFEGEGHFKIEESFVPANAFPGREGKERIVKMRRLPA